MRLIDLTVNGFRREVAVNPTETLGDVLRREFKAYSVREACGIGTCGACTVLVQGRTLSSCLMLAGFSDGLEIETVEGLGRAGALHPIQQAFADQTAFQCSYCTPGFILATKALLAENPHPTAGEARDALAGNLCRCGSYTKILEAVLVAADRSAEEQGPT